MRPKMIEGLVQAGERDFKHQPVTVLVNVETPTARLALALAHQLADDIVGIGQRLVAIG
jgi:hypothetical protein